MNDNESRLQREVGELRAEVRRLERTVQGVFVIIALIAVAIVPQLLVVAIPGAIGYFAFVLTPLGRKTFPKMFR